MWLAREVFRAAVVSLRGSCALCLLLSFAPPTNTNTNTNTITTARAFAHSAFTYGASVSVSAQPAASPRQPLSGLFGACLALRPSSGRSSPRLLVSGASLPNHPYLIHISRALSVAIERLTLESKRHAEARSRRRRR